MVAVLYYYGRHGSGYKAQKNATIPHVIFFHYATASLLNHNAPSDRTIIAVKMVEEKDWRIEKGQVQ